MTNRSIAICDQNQLFREGLRSLLANTAFTVISAAETLADILDDDGMGAQPDLIICGLESDDDLADELGASRYPTKGGPKLVVLANTPTASVLRQAAEAGVRAVLSKNISGEVLQRALDLVLLGQALFPAPQVEPQDDGRVKIEPPFRSLRAAQLIERSSAGDQNVQLSEREAQILRCLVDGAPNKRIARDLSITEATVKVHIKGLLRKLRVNNRTQAAVWGLSNPYATEPRFGPTLSIVEAVPPLAIAS